jgi:hypothetical protein
MSTDRSYGNRIPSEVKVELLSVQRDLLSQVSDVLLKVGVPGGGDGQAWVDEHMRRHADGDILIISARVGRLVVGFLMLELSSMSAPYSWVAARFRNRGIGERFYSFACINLGTPTPCFLFPRDMHGEYADALKGIPIESANDADFCAIHPTAAVKVA